MKTAPDVEPLPGVLKIIPLMGPVAVIMGTAGFVASSARKTFVGLCHENVESLGYLYPSCYVSPVASPIGTTETS